MTRPPGKLDFFDLALDKRRFPSTKVRFCTEYLKIYPTADHIARLKYEGKDVIAVSGVRADESDDRALLSEWGYSGSMFCYQWRPLNPLYAIGAQRVGCWPCIMSRKEEIRIIALRFPERIDEIEKAEQQFLKRYGRYSSFFSSTKIPERFRSMDYRTDDGRDLKIATIRDVVRWALTGEGAVGSWEDDKVKENPMSCKSGFCE